ncbi:alpha/beta fold hydrolase [Catenuloplanes japonicus]|uniref:alpha/beta fold hydrolase n=1 Tax=Catenuloplanes japonicus TaxID=33876 RepID=UPI000527148B|nr:alpha/beta fold hydrolase [Catenuloplanes japonicus]
MVHTDDGVRLWTDRTGRGGSHPLVLCHGGPGLWDYLGDVAALLGDVTEVVRWDQRGCGRSEKKGPYTIARSVNDLDAVRQSLPARRISLFGHSWGAMLALRYALSFPFAVEKLIYVSGTGVDPQETWQQPFHHAVEERIAADGNLGRWRDLSTRDRSREEDREWAILQWTTDFADPSTARAHAEKLATPWPGVNHEAADALNADNAAYLRDHDVPDVCKVIPVPVLIIDGDQDLRPRRAVDSLEATLPDVRRVTIRGAGHSPWVEDPDGFREIVAEFL